MSLYDYATETQAKYLRAVDEHGSQRKAAKALGVHSSTIDRAMHALRAKAARAGYAPEHDMVKTAPDGFHVKGVSTLYRDDGTVAQQWVKTQADRERQEALMREAIAAMRDEIRPEKRVKAPRSALADLLCQYTITDYHLGALAWGEETGADWDTAIAEDLLVRWFAMAIEQAPAAETAILAQLGDFLHYDSLEAVTPTSKHILDADTRFANVVRAAIRAFRRIVRMLLAKHQRVHIIMAEGNHDMASSVWLRETFAALYDDEPRVTVETRPDPYYCYEHGETILFYHHGHKRKLEAIETVFVAKFREQFGKAKHAYAHMGHLHHNHAKETNLMTVEQHRTLAAPDAHASRGGWMSGRDAKVITYHKRHGEVGRATISPEMVK